MTRTLTAVQQQTEIGEGLAVGTLVLGVTAITSRAEPLDVALSDALRSWPWAARYPMLMRRSALELAPLLRASTGRRGSKIARWELSRGLFVPQLRDDDWDLAAACHRIEDSTTIAARHWISLSRAFLDGLDASLVWRAPQSSLMDELDSGLSGWGHRSRLQLSAPTQPDRANEPRSFGTVSCTWRWSRCAPCRTPRAGLATPRS